MKAVSTALRNTLIREGAIHVQPRLIAEWEYNRFYTPTVTITPQQTGNDLWASVYGDTGTVVVPNRPAAGIAKARLDSEVKPLTSQRVPTDTRFYPADDKDLFNYFSSLQTTHLTASNGAYEFDTPVTATVIYPKAISTNKVVVGFETGYAIPKSTTIQVTQNGTSWTTISTNPVIGADGTVTLWRGRTGTWTGVAAYDWPTTITGVRVLIYSMNKANSHVDLLQISPRLENDLTQYLVSYNVQNEISSPSFIAPLGQCSSNTGSVTLSNIDGRFNNDNEDSLYYHMIEKKVRFKLDIGYDTTPQGGKGFEYVREFTMWTDTWGSQNNSTIDVSLKDSSIILQEQTMPSIYLEDATVGAIVWQTLDKVGMTNYEFNTTEAETGQIIPFYWPSDNASATNADWLTTVQRTKNKATTTIWDEFAGLAEATQTAIYFDEYDVLQITTRKAMFDSGKSVDWNFDAVPNGEKMPDVVSTETSYDLTTNQVEITYKPCAMSEDQNGNPKMEIVWQPSAEEDDSIVPTESSSGSSDVMLRASSIIKDLLKTGTSLYITQAEALIWPYESDINIEGEILHYKGKEYGYYVPDGNKHTLLKKVIYTLEEKEALDALDEFYSFKNAFTGRMVVTDRALYGSLLDDHKVRPDTYVSVQTNYEDTYGGTWGGGKVWNPGYLSLTNNSTKPGRINLMRHESNLVYPSTEMQGKTFTQWYGTRLRFSGGDTDIWNAAGLYFKGGDIDSGYYLEFVTTEMCDEVDFRVNHNEVSLVGMPSFAPAVRLKADNGTTQGYANLVAKGTWYDIDVKTVVRNYNTTTLRGSMEVSVFVNGAMAGTWTLSPSKQVNYTNHNRFGVYVRGNTTVDVDYLYAFSEDDENPLRDPDTTGFLDLKTGSYRSGFFQKEVKYNFRNINPHGYGTFRLPQRISDTKCILDEFGPVVHEVRKFNVAFDTSKLPVVSSYPLLSNAGKVEVLYYLSDATGAEFMIANASRQNEMLNGEDTWTAGADNAIDHTMFIYGRCVYTAQNDRTLLKKDDAAIRRQGLVKTQWNSRYIQTDDMATAIGQWVLDLWAIGIDEVNAEVFGNPLLQLGDLVTMNYPTKGMHPSTHKYYVHTISNKFDSGYTSSVTLRRARV